MIKMTLCPSLLAILVLTGCSTSHVILGKKRPPTSPEQVQVFSSPPNVPYEQIAMVSADSSFSSALSEKAKVLKVVERMRKKAAKLGANGVILGGIGETYFGSLGAGPNADPANGMKLSVRDGQGTAIFILPNESEPRVETVNEILGVNISVAEKYFKNGERVSAETIGMKIDIGEQEPEVVIFLDYEWRRAITMIAYDNLIESVIITIEDPPMDTIESARLLELFSDGNSWKRVEPSKPEYDIEWVRSDEKYYAAVALKIGSFLVANSELIPRE